MIWYIAKTWFLMGNRTNNIQHLDDLGHCPPETLMITKPNMNPNMEQNVGIHFRSLCTFNIIS